MPGRVLSRAARLLAAPWGWQPEACCACAAAPRSALVPAWAQAAIGAARACSSSGAPGPAVAPPDAPGAAGPSGREPETPLLHSIRNRIMVRRWAGSCRCTACVQTHLGASSPTRRAATLSPPPCPPPLHPRPDPRRPAVRRRLHVRGADQPAVGLLHGPRRVWGGRRLCDLARGVPDVWGGEARGQGEGWGWAWEWGDSGGRGWVEGGLGGGGRVGG